jgi:spermidine synthase
MLGQLVGHTVYAVQAVLAVFFAGMGLGSALCDRWIREDRRFLRAFALLQVAVGAYTLLLWRLVPLVTPAYDVLAPRAGFGPAFPIFTSAVLLLVPTALMGATFPVVAAWWRRRAVRREVGTPYAVNTLAGAAGAWACAFGLIPALGVKGALRSAAVASLVAAAIGWAASRAEKTGAPADTDAPPQDPPQKVSRGALALLLLCTGFIGIALEVLWSRALEQVLSGTVFTFVTVLGVLLVGLALGAGLYGSSIGRVPSLTLFVTLEFVLAAYVLASVTLIRFIPAACDTLRTLLGWGSFGAGLRLEILASAGLLLVPATAMGLLFPLLLDLAPVAGARRLGALVAANTLGSVAGPLAAGFFLLPRLGLRGSLGAVAWLALSLGLAVFFLGRRTISVWIPALGITACLLFAALIPGSPPVLAGPSEQLVAFIEDPAATVSVVRDPGGLLLKVNNTLYLGGDVGLETERRQGHLPMFLGSAPRRVLVLGVGTGATVGAISLHQPERLVAVELVQGVLDVAREYFRGSNEAILENPRAEVLCGDALRIVRTDKGPYDLVVGDLFHPWQAGVGALYSRDHFEEVQRLLAPGGVFCQWLPLLQLTPVQLRTVIRTFLAVFPHDQAWLGTFGTDMPVLGLVGSREPLAYDVDRWRAGCADATLGRGLRAAHLASLGDALGGYLGGRGGLERFAGTGPLNTQDDPRIEFGTPEIWEGSPAVLNSFETLLALEPEPAVPLRGGGAVEAGQAAVAAQAGRSLVRARLRLRAGDSAGAVEAALQAVRSGGGFEAPVALLRELGWALATTRPELAERIFRAWTQERPGDPEAFYSLGVTCLVLQKTDDASEAFGRALSLRPGWELAQRGLSEAERQGSRGGSPRTLPPGRP